MFPPESDFEQQVQEALLARLKVERSAWLPCRRLHRTTRAVSCQDLTGSAGRLDSIVADAKWLLQSEPAAHWTVDALARRVRCNRTDLEAGFRLRYSLTVHTFLVGCRVEAAKALLRQTAWRLEEIAKDVGCRSKTSLYEHFSKAVHMTPGEYRRRWTLVAANHPVERLLSVCCNECQ
jgi:transcriptional regulator GlxA family with amidase domain